MAFPENTNLEELFQTFRLEEANESIPAITIKNPKEKGNYETARRNYQEYQRILPLQILDIHLSTLINNKPAMYRFANQNYRNTQIAGTVVSKRTSKENKLTIGVDDGSAYISCLLENTESDFKIRSDINNLDKECLQFKPMDKEELNKFAGMNIGEFMKNIADKEDQWLVTCTKIFVDKLNNQMANFPLIDQINIGDNVIIIGNVSDFMNQRLIFVEALKRITDMTAFSLEMLKIIRHKESYLETK